MSLCLLCPLVPLPTPQYSLSLPDNRRNADGTCDFAKFEGLEGVYVANIYDSESLVGTGSSFSTMGKAKGDTADR